MFVAFQPRPHGINIVVVLHCAAPSLSLFLSLPLSLSLSLSLHPRVLQSASSSSAAAAGASPSKPKEAAAAADPKKAKADRMMEKISSASNPWFDILQDAGHTGLSEEALKALWDKYDADKSGFLDKSGAGRV